MSEKLQVLIVTPSESLRTELRDLLKSIDSVGSAPLVASDNRQGLELARTRSPQLAIVELSANTVPAQSFAREMSAVAPDTMVVGLLKPEFFASAPSESRLLIDSLRSGLKDFLNYPVSKGELEELIRRLGNETRRSPAQLGAVFSFISNKGGVGKSTLSVNAAAALAQRHPDRVLLVDASLQLGVAASLLDLQPTSTLTDAAREQNRLDQTLLEQLTIRHSSGLHLLAAPKNPIEATRVTEEILTQVLTLGRRTYDYVIVDTFPVFDAITVALLDLTTRAYVVSENVVPTLLGAASLIELLDQLAFPSDHVEVIINRFQNLSGSLGREDIAARIGRNVDWVLPYDKRVISAANLGRPIIEYSPTFFKFRRTLAQLVDSMEEVVGHANSNGSTLERFQAEFVQTLGEGE
ncbi:AAA family ATPase [Blastopirellula retiformator]|uniref:Septum site-determining protein MinD n=1 Tax=Blastopirellula retiformator TaxID=2527970 RepID=A0A5C5V7R8_9BACT|nr:AAA family ATPase [Blastopirellula retiformator]TWT34614.1 Septum site-determining protein MinD [Blastopirellula retiformator]